MSKQTTKAAMLGTIDDLLKSLDNTKQAGAYTEPGSIGGATTHPSKDVDDSTGAASEGSRSSENSSDVKEDQGKPGVDSASAVQPGTAAKDHYGIGMNPQATGDDPANETGSTKAHKDDPGSSHPARTDNNSLDGFKYSAANATVANFNKLAELSAKLGEEMVTLIALENQKSAGAKPAPAAKPAAAAAPVAPTAPANKAAEAAAQAGAELAVLADNEKQAAEQLNNVIHNEITHSILNGFEMGEKVATFLISRNEALRKAAEEEEARSEEEGSEEGGGGEGGGGGAPPPGAGGDPGMGAGGPPPGADPGAGGMPGMGGGGAPQLPPELIQMLLAGGQGGGMGGGDALAGMAGDGPGGMPPGAGGDPLAALGGGGGGAGLPGGMPPGGGGGAPGMEGGGGPEGGLDPALLMQILQDQGSNPQELEAAAASKTAAAEKPTVWTAKTAADRRKYAYYSAHIAEVLRSKR